MPESSLYCHLKQNETFGLICIIFVKFEPIASEVVPRERRPDYPITWTGPGFRRASNGAVLRFAVTNVPASLQYHLLIHYEPEVSACHDSS